MSALTGYACKLYHNTGTYGSPTWVEIATTRDVAVTNEKTVIDASVRGGNGYRQNVQGLKDVTFEFQLLFDTTDAGFTAIRDAFNNDTNIDLLALSGPVGTAGNQGQRAVCLITKFSRNEGLEEAVTVDVTAKPAAGAAAPNWFTST